MRLSVLSDGRLVDCKSTIPIESVPNGRVASWISLPMAKSLTMFAMANSTPLMETCRLTGNV